MDLSQTKLTKTEWDSIEVPVSDDEKKVLELIVDGYETPSIKRNETQSILNHLKIDYSPEMDYYLYKTQFESRILEMVSHKNPTKYVKPLQSWIQTQKKMKTKSPNSRDTIRINNTVNMIQNNRHAIFEFVLLDFIKWIVCPENETQHKKEAFYVYSLISFKQYSILKLNKYVMEIVDTIIAIFNPTSTDAIQSVFYNAHECIERNPYLIQYEDAALYSHQEKLFRLFNTRKSREIPKLVLYMAPTGTGKTLSPLGLSHGYRVIFVCVARHVGLALAKSAISVNKKVAFAFGCETASDIRLHYFSAVDYKINKRSGGIGKVDNSNGSKVEIMICDVASYITAMHYMIAFNPVDTIITYWDEPTITMDYDTHVLHETIHNNWKQNKIPKMVLSCATLPKATEITSVIQDFQLRFSVFDEETESELLPEIHTIDSYDCKKSISLLNKDGKAMLPHLLFSDYAEIIRCVRHCEQNKALLRYFDVEEILKFIKYTLDHKYVNESLSIVSKFSNVLQINLRSIKLYYLEVLSSIQPDKWHELHTHFVKHSNSKLYLKRESKTNDLRKIHSHEVLSHSMSAESGGALRRVNSIAITEKPDKLYSNGLQITTCDAYTLTDGPTIFLAEDVEKIGLFYIQQAKIPDSVLQTVLSQISKNNEIQKQMDTIQKEIEDKEAASGASDRDKKKADRDPALNREVAKLMDRLDILKSQIEYVSLNPKYIPNTIQHQEVWIPLEYAKPTNLFVPNIDQENVKDIMALNVDNQKKLLLILGIGVFDMNANIQYMEIMKQLALEKRLFLIIASSDYIYGTNYQFSHGFIGKDLENMTQQKIIQAIGRIGRNNIQQDYTVRFRDNDILTRLFKQIQCNKEAIVMSQLFSSD